MWVRHPPEVDFPKPPVRTKEKGVRFFCDAMLGGLARWLRGAGYDASFVHGIDDGDLVRRCAEEGRVLLSSDSGIFLRNVVKDGSVRALFVPRATPPVEQLAFVLRELALETRDARCMCCSGELAMVAKGDVAGEVPPRSFEAFDEFWRCVTCAKVYWHGTHWSAIQKNVEPRPAAMPRSPKAIPSTNTSSAREGKVSERPPPT